MCVTTKRNYLLGFFRLFVLSAYQTKKMLSKKIILKKVVHIKSRTKIKNKNLSKENVGYKLRKNLPDFL